MFVRSLIFLSAAAFLAGLVLPASAEVDFVRPEDEDLLSGIYVESKSKAPYTQRQTFGSSTVGKSVYRRGRLTRQNFVPSLAEEDDFFVPMEQQDEDLMLEVGDDDEFLDFTEEAEWADDDEFIDFTEEAELADDEFIDFTEEAELADDEFIDFTEEAELAEEGDECPMWGRSGGCYGYGSDVDGNDSYYRFWQYMAKLGFEEPDDFDDDGDWRSLGFARRAALLPLSDRSAFYRAGVEACSGMYKDDIEAQKATLYNGNVYDNTAQLSHIFALINKCYEEIGYGSINDYYNADLRIAQNFSAKVKEFYVQGAGLNFDPIFCGERCSLTDLTDDQVKRFDDFKLYLLELITKRPRSGYGYDF